MEWIMLGIVAGSLVVSQFATKEACLGRVATLREQKIEAKCVEAPRSSSGIIWNGGQLLCTDKSCTVPVQ